MNMKNTREKSSINNSLELKRIGVLSVEVLSRFVSIDSLFNTVLIDNTPNYVFKDIKYYNSSWYEDKLLSNVYNNNSIFMCFEFIEDSLPKRCEDSFDKLCVGFSSYLHMNKSRVSMIKVKAVVKHLIKHVSRLYFHKKYCIKYTRQKRHWNNTPRLSWSYMMDLISYLQDKGFIVSYRGYQSGVDISSMLLVKPEFINFCNNHDNKSQSHMDVCLKPSRKPSFEIRREDKKPRNPTRGEFKMAVNIENLVDSYNKFLDDKLIMIGGVRVPEIFFRRVFNVDLNHGGRWYDDGSIQGECSQVRSTILIDGMETKEVDYSSLHYSMAAEELGVDLSGKDPYDFVFDLELDMKEIEDWKLTTGYTGYYNPIRNLKKSALLIMFNANNISSAKSGISKGILDDYKVEEKIKRKYVGLKNIPVTQLVEALLRHNEIVSDYLLSGVGVRFQNLDSKMVEYCIKEFIAAGEVCLPVHDSLVVKETIKPFAIKVMHEAYENVMGSAVNCRVK